MVTVTIVTCFVLFPFLDSLPLSSFLCSSMETNMDGLVCCLLSNFLANSALSELGTAQPQLFSHLYVNRYLTVPKLLNMWV